MNGDLTGRGWQVWHLIGRDLYGSHMCESGRLLYSVRRAFTHFIAPPFIGFWGNVGRTPLTPSDKDAPNSHRNHRGDVSPCNTNWMVEGGQCSVAGRGRRTVPRRRRRRRRRHRRVEDDQISHPTFLPSSEMGFSYLRSLQRKKEEEEICYLENSLR